MAHSKETGIECLLQFHKVHIKQKKSGFKGNTYIVMAPNDEVLYEMKEDGSALNVLMNGENRAFNIDVVDNQQRTVFSLRRPHSFYSDKVEVSMNGKLASIVRREQTMMKAVFSINDANNTPVLRIKGSLDEYTFKLQTLKKNDIGSITKTFRGMMKELFSYKDNYIINFPADLDVRYKAAVISACILIDYRYHES